MTTSGSLGPEKASGRGLSFRGKVALAAEILSAYIRVRWWLWRKDFPRTLSALRATRAIADSNNGTDQLSGVRLGRIVSRTLGRLPFDARCLIRALVLTRLLARRGIASSLVIGVTSEPEFAAHAWVESGGVPLLPREASVYRRLVEI